MTEWNSLYNKGVNTKIYVHDVYTVYNSKSLRNEWSELCTLRVHSTQNVCLYVYIDRVRIKIPTQNLDKLPYVFT